MPEEVAVRVLGRVGKHDGGTVGEVTREARERVLERLRGIRDDQNRGTPDEQSRQFLIEDTNGPGANPRRPALDEDRLALNPTLSNESRHRRQLVPQRLAVTYAFDTGVRERERGGKLGRHQLACVYEKPGVFTTA